MASDIYDGACEVRNAVQALGEEVVQSNRLRQRELVLIERLCVAVERLAQALTAERGV